MPLWQGISLMDQPNAIFSFHHRQSIDEQILCSHWDTVSAEQAGMVNFKEHKVEQDFLSKLEKYKLSEPDIPM